MMALTWMPYEEIERLPAKSVVLDSDLDAWQRTRDVGWVCVDRDVNDFIGDYGPFLILWSTE